MFLGSLLLADSYNPADLTKNEISLLEHTAWHVESVLLLFAELCKEISKDKQCSNSIFIFFFPK